MNSLGLSPEAMKERRRKYQKRYYRRNRARELKKKRAERWGYGKLWWIRACQKAGVRLPRKAFIRV